MGEGNVKKRKKWKIKRERGSKRGNKFQIG
jgi:hypothetical protein